MNNQNNKNNYFSDYFSESNIEKYSKAKFSDVVDYDNDTNIANFHNKDHYHQYPQFQQYQQFPPINDQEFKLSRLDNARNIMKSKKNLNESNNNSNIENTIPLNKKPLQPNKNQNNMMHQYNNLNNANNNAITNVNNNAYNFKTENFNFSFNKVSKDIEDTDIVASLESAQSFDQKHRGYKIRQIESNDNFFVLEYTFSDLQINNNSIIAQFCLSIKRDNRDDIGKDIDNKDNNFVDYIPKIINCVLDKTEELLKEEIDIHKDDIPKLITIFLNKLYFNK